MCGVFSRSPVYLHRNEAGEMDKKDLLEYTRALRARQTDQAARRGFTVWALFAGMVYVLWTLVPQLVELHSLRVSPHVLSTYTANALIALGSGFVIVNMASIAGKTGPFDRRIESQTDIYGLVSVCLQIAVTVALPAYLSWLGLRESVQSGLPALQLTINAWSCGIVATLVVIIGSIETIYRLKTGYPLPYTIQLGRNSKFDLAEAVMPLLTVELFVGNIYSLGANLLSNPVNGTQFLASINISLLCLGLVALIRASTEHRFARSLDRIERDLVLHEIDVQDARQRLEDELLGCHFGGWLSNRLLEVRNAVDDLTRFADQSEKAIDEIIAIDPSYRLERDGRIQQFRAFVSSKHKAYLDRARPLLNWLRVVSRTRSSANDDFIFHLLGSAIDSLDEASERTSAALKTLAAATAKLAPPAECRASASTALTS